MLWVAELTFAPNSIKKFRNLHEQQMNFQPMGYEG